MVRPTPLLLGLGSALVLVASARCQTSAALPGFAGSASFWSQELTGSLGGRDSVGTSGEGRIQPDRAVALGASADLGVWELGVTRLEHSTRFDVSASFSYDRVAFAAGDEGRLDHQVTAIDLFRRWTLARSGSGRLVAGLGVKVLDVDSAASNLTTMAKGTVDATLPFPMLSLAGRVGSERGLSGFGAVRWFGATIGEAEAEMVELSFGADQSLGRNLHLAAGYRSLAFDFDYRQGRSDASRLDLEHAGPFLELGAKF